MKIDGEFLSNLRFSCDIFLCTETPQELQQMLQLQELSDESRRMGLKGRGWSKTISVNNQWIFTKFTSVVHYVMPYEFIKFQLICIFYSWISRNSLAPSGRLMLSLGVWHGLPVSGRESRGGRPEVWDTRLPNHAYSPSILSDCPLGEPAD